MSVWLAGTYTEDMGGTAEGILALRTTATGGLEVTGTAAPAASPSYLALDGTTVYAVAEGEGRLAAFALDGSTLTALGDTSAGGEAPCHIGVYGSAVIVSNYVSGTLGMIDAEPLDLVQTLAAEGSGPHSAQDGPHAHSTLRLDDGTVLSADLGADRIHVHALGDGRLERTASLELPPGTGPRDIVALPDGRLLVLAELSARLLLLRWSGSLSVVTSVALAGAAEGDHAAGISLSRDGRFVYVALRGSNRVSVIAIDGDELTAVDSVSCAGDWPRHLVVEGDVLHVANQLSSTVTSFSIGSDGIPQLLETTAVPSPTFLLRVSE